MTAVEHSCNPAQHAIIVLLAYMPYMHKKHILLATVAFYYIIGHTICRKIKLSNCKGVVSMLAELRQKSQITIPKEIVTKLGLNKGDKLEVAEKDGIISMMPVTVYPKKYLEELRNEIEEAKSKIASGKQPVFSNIDELISELERN